MCQLRACQGSSQDSISIGHVCRKQNWRILLQIVFIRDFRALVLGMSYACLVSKGARLRSNCPVQGAVQAKQHHSVYHGKQQEAFYPQRARGSSLASMGPMSIEHSSLASMGLMLIEHSSLASVGTHVDRAFVIGML